MNIREVIDLQFGGRGSGCTGPNCGRPPGRITDKNGTEYIVNHSTHVDNEGNTRHRYEVTETGLRPGQGVPQPVASVEMDRKGEAAMSLGVYPEFQRKGVATALYKYIEEHQGKPLIRNKYQTDEGQAFWRSR